MRRLTWSEITPSHVERWRTALLVLTDHCTIGCTHYSHRYPKPVSHIRACTEQPVTALAERTIVDAQHHAGAVGSAQQYGPALHASLVTLGLDATDAMATATAASDGRTRGALCDV